MNKDAFYGINIKEYCLLTLLKDTRCTKVVSTRQEYNFFKIGKGDHNQPIPIYVFVQGYHPNLKLPFSHLKTNDKIFVLFLSSLSQ